MLTANKFPFGFVYFYEDDSGIQYTVSLGLITFFVSWIPQKNPGWNTQILSPTQIQWERDLRLKRIRELNWNAWNALGLPHYCFKLMNNLV